MDRDSQGRTALGIGGAGGFVALARGTREAARYALIAKQARMSAETGHPIHDLQPRAERLFAGA